MKRTSGWITFLSGLLCLIAAIPAAAGENETLKLTVIAIADAGETGSALRACGSYANDMFSGRHDGGVFDAMIFLGDNFYNTGLNGPADDAASKASDVLGKFKEALSGLGRANVHAIPGEHDYYTRNLIEMRYLFGLFSSEDMPVGLSDKGNQREAALNEWTFHYGMPAEVTFPIEPGSTDSAQFILVDSALPLRTPQSSWHAALDSLKKVLSDSKQRNGIRWRIFCSHHPFRSVGEHAGYSVWNDETKAVEYLTRCDKDSNAYAWFQNTFDPEDLCAEKYRQYVDSVKAVIDEVGVRIQLALSGHDHSLQLLNQTEGSADASGFPKVQIISGAGSMPMPVKFPSPPFEFTSAQTDPKKEGESYPGFVQLQFDRDRLRIKFFNAKTGDWLDMGGGNRTFWLDTNGSLHFEAILDGR